MRSCCEGPSFRGLAGRGAYWLPRLGWARCLLACATWLGEVLIGLRDLAERGFIGFRGYSTGLTVGKGLLPAVNEVLCSVGRLWGRLLESGGFSRQPCIVSFGGAAGVETGALLRRY